MLRLILIAAVLTPALAVAHPVSFEDGTMPVFELDGDSYSAHLNHSFTSRTALGLHYYTMPQQDSGRFHNAGLTLNRLFKRWLLEDSQANLYGWAGPLLQRSDSRTNGGGVLGLQADWESRRLYSALEGQSMLVSGGVNYSYAKLRAGFAPYLSAYDGWHTFLIGQAQYKDAGSEHVWEFSPVVRVFRGPLLAELGISNRGNISGMLMAQVYF